MMTEDLKTWSEPALLRYMEGLSEREEWTPATAREFDAAKAEYDKRMTRKAATAKPVRRIEPGDEGGATCARFVAALALGRGDPLVAAHHAEARGWSYTARALGAGEVTGGGVLVPQEVSGEVIAALRAKSVVFRAGPRVVTMSGTELTIPKVALGVSGSYLGENGDITASQQQFGQIRLTAKKLAALVPVSNDLIRAADPAADAVIRDDLVAGLQVTADAALLRGDGTAAGPKGLRYWAAAGNVTASNGATAADIEGDLLDLAEVLAAASVPMVKPAWIMPPRSYFKLYGLRDANGALIYPELRQVDPEAPEGRLYGFRVFSTANIPTNLGGGSETEIYLVDFDSIVIAQQAAVTIAVSDTASYSDGGGVVSAFSRDQTVIRAIALHDIAARHPEAIALKTGVTW